MCGAAEGLNRGEEDAIIYETELDGCDGEQLALFSDTTQALLFAVEENLVNILDRAIIRPDAAAYHEVVQCSSLSSSQHPPSNRAAAYQEVVRCASSIEICTRCCH
jgi:hypothetical protein